MTSPPERTGDRPDDAALLLVESLIHELVAAGTLASDRATAVVEIALDARTEIRLGQAASDRSGYDALSVILGTLRHER